MPRFPSYAPVGIDFGWNDADEEDAVAFLAWMRSEGIDSDTTRNVEYVNRTSVRIDELVRDPSSGTLILKGGAPVRRYRTVRVSTPPPRVRVLVSR